MSEARKSAERLKIIGSHGSPYSMKMLAALRYRGIPHDWRVRKWGREEEDIPPVPVALIPIIVLPGAKEALIDSTPIIRKLEEAYDGRAITPPHGGLRFLDALIEDYGDEWMTKAMFYYRWSFADDIEKAKTILPRWGLVSMKEEDLKPVSDMVAERQIGRLALVGCDKTTAPTIEESYRESLKALDDMMSERPFIMGDRPGAADFGVYGQLSQLALFDPTSARIALETAPRIVAWSSNMSDLSGLEISERGWLTPDEAEARLKPLLALVGKYYAPFLLANAEALAKGEKETRCEIAGRAWVQGSFPYQGKCLKWLRDHYSGLGSEDRAFVDRAMSGTGAEALFA